MSKAKIGEKHGEGQNIMIHGNNPQKTGNNPTLPVTWIGTYYFNPAEGHMLWQHNVQPQTINQTLANSAAPSWLSAQFGAYASGTTFMSEFFINLAVPAFANLLQMWGICHLVLSVFCPSPNPLIIQQFHKNYFSDLHSCGYLESAISFHTFIRQIYSAFLEPV